MPGLPTRPRWWVLNTKTNWLITLKRKPFSGNFEDVAHRIVDRARLASVKYRDRNEVKVNARDVLDGLAAHTLVLQRVDFYAKEHGLKFSSFRYGIFRFTKA